MRDKCVKRKSRRGGKLRRELESSGECGRVATFDESTMLNAYSNGEILERRARDLTLKGDEGTHEKGPWLSLYTVKCLSNTTAIWARPARGRAQRVRRDPTGFSRWRAFVGWVEGRGPIHEPLALRDWGATRKLLGRGGERVM